MAKPDIALQFINVSNPRDAASSRKRKAVRSHVTRLQHKSRRENVQPSERRRKQKRLGSPRGDPEAENESSTSSSSTSSPIPTTADVRPHQESTQTTPKPREYNAASTPSLLPAPTSPSNSTSSVIEIGDYPLIHKDGLSIDTRHVGVIPDAWWPDINTAFV